MPPNYNPKVKLRLGDRITIDGSGFKIVERTSPDRFKVRNLNDFEEHEWHIDEFARRISMADEFVIIGKRE